MRLLKSSLVLIPFLLNLAAGKDHLRRHADEGEPASYIITFADHVSDRRGQAEALARAHGGTVEVVYNKVLNGFAGRFPEQAHNGLGKSPFVSSIELDGIMESSAVASWGLDRIDQCEGLDNAYSPATTNAADVKMYIIDTGILASHNDFGGRVDSTCSTCPACRGQTTALDDGNGHGTHVASTACGDTYGVASSCKLCAIGVLDKSGSGSTSGVIAGIDFVAANCDSANGEKCVANMSLGGGFSSALNSAVKNAVASGVVVVVAAGNENADACTKSPASEPSAITVGATTNSDAPASYTNFGSCTDIYAPGTNIKAAWKGSDSDTRTISGTSMASPHVAGIAAIMLQNGEAAVDVASQIKTTQTFKDVDSRSSGVGIAVVPGTKLAGTEDDCSSVVNTGGGGGGGGGCQAISPSCNNPCDPETCCSCQTYVGCQGGRRSLCTGTPQ